MTTDILEFADDLGPTKILHVYEPKAGLNAVLVIDNVAAGPALGGIRMAPDVTVEECFRLARAMTLKNAAAGLPHGGGKVVVYGDPKMPKDDKMRIVRALACSLRDIKEYILAPDMGIDEECMAWAKDEIDRVAGLPFELGGIPLDEVGATGWGLVHSAEVAASFCDFDLMGAKFVIQGFGAVGKNAARFLADKGAILVGVSDSGGAIGNPKGLDIELLSTLKDQRKSVTVYDDCEQLSSDQLIAVDCDIWIPAARPDVITAQNVKQLRAKLVMQGANIPCTPDAEQYMHENGVLCLPDFICNAGGVICAAMEYQGASHSVTMTTIEEKLRRNTSIILEKVKKENIPPRQASVQYAVGLVKKMMSYRRWSFF